MAKRKYTLIDDNGEIVGFVVVEQNVPMQHVINPSLPADGPMADAALFLVVLGGFTGAAWLLPGPDWLAPTLGITVTAALAGIKAWRGGWLPDDGGQADQLTIKLETWMDEGRVLFDEIQDKSISLDEWRKVAKAIVQDGVNFSRPALAGVISQTAYHKIKDEFVRLRFAHRNGNSYVLSPRAMAFLRKVNTLPR